VSDQEQERPAAIVVTLLGERLELLMPGQGWTYTEAKLAKNISDGMTPVEIGTKFFEGDPDATMAIIRVTFHRAGRTLAKSELDQLADLDLEALGRDVLAAIEAAQEKAAHPSTPAGAGSDSTSPDGPSTSTGNDSGEKPSASGGDGATIHSLERTEPEASATAGLPSSATS
jgi:hypothetical protein